MLTELSVLAGFSVLKGADAGEAELAEAEEGEPAGAEAVCAPVVSTMGFPAPGAFSAF